MIKLNFRDSRPLYEQVKEELKKLIIKGAVKTDEKIPSVRELAYSLSINPNTIQRAYRELEQEGYIYSLRAKGFFVSPISEDNTKEKVEKLKNELRNTLKELEYLNADKKEVEDILDEVFKKGVNK